MKILILGSTGMLGNAVANYFCSKKDYQVTTTSRKNSEAICPGRDKLNFDPLMDNLNKLENPTKPYDYVINCIGIIKPFMAENPIASRKINTVFPWELADWCNSHGSKLIHITTDCVFSGKDGKYTEESTHDAHDAYGKSKSLGEPTDRCMVLRTSIVGEEIHKNASLISWAKSQKGNRIKGYTNHLWNGITTNRYATICEQIIRNNLYEKGLWHLHAKDDVSKYQMMKIFDDKFCLKLTIEPLETTESIDRTLRSIKGLCNKLAIPSVLEMIQEI